MPARVKQYLNNMDKAREEVDSNVDDSLKKIDIKLLIANPEKYLKLFVLTFIKKNNKLFLDASKHGKSLAKSLK